MAAPYRWSCRTPLRIFREIFAFAAARPFRPRRNPTRARGQSMSPERPELQPARSRGGGRLLLSAIIGLLVTVASAPAQETGWSGRLFLQAQSVEDARDWLVFRQTAARRFAGERRLAVGLVQTRRFGNWDASLEAGGTLRPADETYLSLDARFTPDADVLEDARVGARAFLPLGELVPSLGYRLRIFGEDAVHSVSPRVSWYRGPWLFFGEMRIIRSAVETTNLALIGRVARRLSASWSVRLGVARGEEDFLVGRPPRQSLRTLTTRSLSAGVEHELARGWSVRMSATGVDSDPRLDRLGVSILLTRAF